MTYADERAGLGRKSALIAELDLDFCANVYSETHANLVIGPENFSNNAWLKNNCSVTIDQAVAPDGKLTADKVIFNGTNDPGISQTYLVDPSSKTYQWSIYARTDAGQPTNAQIFIYGNVGLEVIQALSYVLTTDWQRLEISTTFGAGAASTGVVARIAGAQINNSGEFQFIFGAQLTEGATLFRYGVATCTAALAAGLECRNTRLTCQDPLNYENHVPRTYSLSNVLIEGENFLPCITSSELAPTVIDPDKGLGQRAEISLSARDFPYHDRGVDPYFATRTYDPSLQGTYFGKLIASNPFYAGRTLRIKTGYIVEPFSLDDFQTRYYVLDNIEGPDSVGRVMIKAKDILAFADDDRAVAPAPSTGLLVAAITDSASTLTVTSGTEGEYNLEGDFIRIGSEAIKAPIGSRTANVFASLTRGVKNTQAASHALGDQVQACKDPNSANVVDLVEDLLINYTKITAQFIDSLDWAEQRDTWFGASLIDQLITEPTGINKIINELAEQHYFQIWPNEITQQIVIRAIVPPRPGTVIPELNQDEHLAKGSVFKTKVDDKRRITRVIVYYNPRNPIDFTESADYDGLYIKIAGPEEGPDQYDDTRQRVILGRYIRSLAIAVQTGGRMLSRYANPPREAKILVDAKDADLWTGDLVNLSTRRIQDPNGADALQQYQITSAQEMTNEAASSKFKYTVLETKFASRPAYIGPNTLNDYDVESESNRLRYGFIAPDTAIFSDDTVAFTII